ncbi:kinase D-interacting substrate of 220 kDa-like isoform X2 [Tigriopus californicus]|uniref:kinase D-interacting substrate of 220 kDa-like isoform X2 n=1 Tax=Tigriopus californicus TaxID=6832 RepID=UPI0027DA26E6|nr:kinase D-interacting substrate of 220 kDa-like isoform X2 [Tigriopus californicus]
MSISPPGTSVKCKYGIGNSNKESKHHQHYYHDVSTTEMVGGLSNRAILELIRSNNLLGLKSFLESRHANIEDKDQDGLTPLMVSSDLGRLEFVKLLIANNADPKAEDEDKCTALHLAAKNGHVEVCEELIEAGADLNVLDIGNWTPMIWAAYSGHLSVVEALVNKGAEVNARGYHHVSGLIWASGRGFTDIVRFLLDHQAKVDVGDKYGTTALIWASRNGHKEAVDLLLKRDASVDVVGMYSWTPLLVATSRNHSGIVELLLEKSPNVNATDKDGMAALAIACKEGNDSIALKLIQAGAYVNVQDRAGDTNLIHACKGGHRTIVEALLKKFADVDIKGKENKTCLHWAIDKGHNSIVKILLNTNPDLEIRTVEGDTALLRAVRCRNGEVVQMLLEKKAKISVTDGKGDTALHIAMRARSKGIVEVLLRNPKHSQLLYRPNRQGETPYNIDASSPKTILGQVFGGRRLNTNEDSENILGYDLYSSALADILTEPTLSMPISVGLYAKWGSGKSFLLSKLRQEMKSFAREWLDPTFHMSPMLFIIILHIAAVVAVVVWMAMYLSDLGKLSTGVGLGSGVLLVVVSYLFLIGVWQGSYKYDWNSLYNLSLFLAKQFNSIKLILHVMFCHPPGPEWSGNINKVQPLKLLFTDQTKVITSAGGQNSVTQMIGSLLDEIEGQYGKIASRLFRAFRPQPVHSSSPKRWRKLCCLPYFVIYMVCFCCSLAIIILLCLSVHQEPAPLSTDLTLSDFVADPLAHSGINQKTRDSMVLAFLILFGVLVGVVLISNLYTLGNCFQSLMFSQRRHLQRTVAKLDVVKSEGYLQAVKGEVALMLDMIKGLDAFTNQQSRLVVVVDGLDSCEQSKVLSVLDAVHMLFSDKGSPFIILLAIDPHVITKAIELNLNVAYSDTSIGGNTYLKNIVHLPFFLQNSGLRKVRIALQVAATMKSKVTSNMSWVETEDTNSIVQGRKASVDLNAMGAKRYRYQRNNSMAKGPRSKMSDSLSSSVGSNLNKTMQGPQDLTKVLLSDDYFSDANPRSMRRLMNVLYVMGRLLKAFNIDFNWYHLASWANVTEQWPYRLSWIIFYAERNDEDLEDSTSLKTIYDRVKGAIPTQKEIEPLLELDRDEKKLDTFLNYHKKNLTLADLKVFLPFTINLDPFVKKVIKDEIQNMEEIGVTLEQMASSSSNSSSHFSQTGAPKAPLTRRQMMGLSRRVSQPDMAHMAALKPNAMPTIPSGLMYPPPPGAPPMWPYNMMYPYHQTNSYLGVDPHNSRHQTPSPPPSPQPKLTPREEKLPDLAQSLTMPPLSQRNVESVCDMIQNMEGLSSAMVSTYCSMIKNQNLSGPVLSHCELHDLKSVMGMNFGDWETFRMVIQNLRALEKKANRDSRNVKFTISPERELVSSEGKTITTSTTTTTSSIATRASIETVSRTKHLKHQTSIEKQITMEDQMISGLLSTLNEEAQEDILTEEMEHISSSGNLSDLEERRAESDIVYLSHTTSPSPGVQNRREQAMTDASMENGVTDWINNRIIVSSIGGTSSVTSSTTELKSLVSVPTSPTATATTQSFKSPRPSLKKVDTVTKMRHLRDRLDSVQGERLNLAEKPEDDDDDPYAWISQTAPASPDDKRRRCKSETRNDSATSLFPLNTKNEEFGDPSDRSYVSATSIEKLNKVKRKFKQAMDISGIPASNKNRPSSAKVIPAEKEKKGFFQKLRRYASEHHGDDAIQQLPVESGSEDERLSSGASSPEQVTVARRPSLSRGPHVQDLFVHRRSSKENPTLVAVLPDGSIIPSSKHAHAPKDI